MNECDDVRGAVLTVIREAVQRGQTFDRGWILSQTAKKLNIQTTGKPRNEADERRVLCALHDLFRVGILVPGHNIMNADLEKCHLTDHGRRSIEAVDRDPSNPNGYLANVIARGMTDDVAKSYIVEGLQTYVSGCFKAAAVMVGAATEQTVLLLKEELVAAIRQNGVQPPKNLESWRYKNVRDAITKVLDSKKSDMPNKLRERFDAYWTSLTEHPRTTRNDAGHPTSIDPVTVENVHAAFLMLPELIALVTDLREWIRNAYGSVAT